MNAWWTAVLPWAADHRAAAHTDHRPTAPGISLAVPPGQSVALLSKPRSDSTDLLDVIAGLARPRSGQVLVARVAVNRLSAAELDRTSGPESSRRSRALVPVPTAPRGHLRPGACRSSPIPSTT